MSKQEQQTFVILDGNALLHRAWHAIPPLTTKDGKVVNAVYGFTMIIEKLFEKMDMQYMAVAWDLEGKTFRHEKCESYKATREKKEQELYDQIPMIKELLDAYGIPNLSAAGFEGDDVIGTLANKMKKKGMKVIIISGDLDMLQLVDENVHVVFFQKGISVTKLYDEKAIFDRYELRPDQMIDYKALRGDPSDNIAGVAGVGDKTAVSLLQEYENLEGIFTALEAGKINAKFAKKLTGNKDIAFASRELVEIIQDVVFPFRVTQAKLKKPDAVILSKLFQDYEFQRFFKKYNKDEEKSTPEISSESKKSAAIARDANVVREQFRLFHEKRIGIHVVGKEEDLFGGTLASIAVSDGKTTVVVPNPVEEQMLLLEDLFLHASEIVVHDYKAFLHMFSEQAVNLSTSTKKIFDLKIASYLLQAGNRDNDLDSIFHTFLNGKSAKVPEFFSDDKDFQRLGNVVAEFPELASRVSKKLEEDHLVDLFKDIEMPLAPILFEMEMTGIQLNSSFLVGLSKEFEKRLLSITKKIHSLSGEEFNINSPSQLSVILFEKLDLPIKGIKKTKTNFSTAASELEKLHGTHEIIPLIMEYRELSKLKSTYIDVLPKLIDENNRVHTHFNQTITTTGRLSSSDPNLQNIPIKTDIGQQIRKAFVAGKGKKLIAADYSQIELRLASVIADDKRFKKAFKEGADIHTRTAAEVAGKNESEVTADERRAAKAINFGILYGMGSRALARSTNLSLQEAKEYIKQYFVLHPAIEKYMEETKALAHEQGYVESLFGRKRSFSDINSGIPMLVASAERMAVNMPVQGTASDIMKMAMIAANGWIKALESGSGNKKSFVKMILQVHDELVFEVDEKEVDKAAKAIKEIMETVEEFDIPLTVNVEVGSTWGDMTKWNENS